MSSSLMTFNMVRDGVTITDRAGKTLHCERCNLSNCAHVREALGANLDGEYLYKLSNFNLPLSFEDSVWVQIILGDCIGASSIRPYSLSSDISFYHRGARELPDRAVGVLSPGEGRTVVRLGVAGWLANWALDAKPKCLSSAHKPSFNASAETANGITKMMNLWQHLTTGICYWCNRIVTEVESTGLEDLQKTEGSFRFRPAGDFGRMPFDDDPRRSKMMNKSGRLDPRLTRGAIEEERRRRGKL